MVAGVGLQLQTHFADGREGATQVMTLNAPRGSTRYENSIHPTKPTNQSNQPTHPKPQFLDLQRVRAVVINEGITMHRVVYYMALLVEGKDKLVVAFPVRAAWVSCVSD